MEMIRLYLNGMRIWKATEKLTQEEQLELAEKLIKRVRKKEKKQQLDWDELYELGKGLKGRRRCSGIC
ncbi:MAG: hypothetical protein GF308_03055 [Candidatus Heimdallarchaeota archaeon]|nr:hypothetical protein [Candidatus Heimdallarchaeota archaeon]